MKISSIGILLLFLFSFIECRSQGGIALPYLVAPPDARFSGMGEAGTAVADDINATFWNSGGLAFLRETVIPKSQFLGITKDITTSYFEGTVSISLPYYKNSSKTYLNISAGIYLENLSGTLAFDYTYENLGEMFRTADNGQILGKYIAGEYCFGMAYGFLLNDDLGVGVKAKYFNSPIAPSSYDHNNPFEGDGFAFDLGLLWNPDLTLDSNSILGSKCFSVGISLNNLGSRFNYIKELEFLPTTLRLGIALKIKYLSEHELTIAIDGTKYLIKRDSIGSDPLPKSLISSWQGPLNICLGLGAEYWYKKSLAIRAGFYSEPEALGNRFLITCGASVRIFIIQADISYRSSSELTKYLSNRLSFTLRIGG